jgi:chlorophyll/bacteriochlorophyll a synthase
MNQIQAFLSLSRWREHVPSTVPLTLAGSLIAIERSLAGADPGWGLWTVLIANILAVAFAFMINDIEDAPDDALDPAKKAHNVIASEIIPIRLARIVTWMVAALAMLGYLLSGPWAAVWGGLTLLLAYLYSAHPFRLKARPVTDVVSHILMLAGLLVMTGYFTYASDPGPAWLVVLAAALFSGYGQFYNQLDDFDVDKQAGLHNTAILLGRGPTTLLMYGSLAGAVLSLVLAMLAGVFPAWAGLVFALGMIAALILPWEFDMRGDVAQGLAFLQRPILLVATFVVLLWTADTLGWIGIS